LSIDYQREEDRMDNSCAIRISTSKIIISAQENGSCLTRW
jgi:hypothetical protein